MSYKEANDGQQWAARGGGGLSGGCLNVGHWEIAVAAGVWDLRPESC